MWISSSVSLNPANSENPAIPSQVNSASTLGGFVGSTVVVVVGGSTGGEVGLSQVSQASNSTATVTRPTINFLIKPLTHRAFLSNI